MTDPSQYVTVVKSYDVLFGRGSGPNDHEGNIRFRDVVSRNKAEYMATNHRQTKAKIAKAVVDTVFSNNGRFLKKLEGAEAQNLGFANGMDVYAIVDDATIMEKAKQALRQNREKNSANADASGTGSPGKSNAAATNNSNQVGMPPPVPRTSAGSLQFQGNLSQFDGSNLMNPLPVNSFNNIDQQPIYREDAEGYATYITTLDDPDDNRLFPNRRQSSNMTTGTRRGSLLGGRKDGGRRGSVETADQWRRDSMMGGRGESMQMSDLMESFKGMSTTGELNSTDTIGTIEGDVYGKNQLSGLSNMSAMSLSSNASLFKGSGSENENSDKLGDSPLPVTGVGVPTNPNEVSSAAAMGWLAQQQQLQMQQQQQLQQLSRAPDGVAHSRVSMIPKDAWTSGNLQHLLRAPIDGSSTNLTMDGSSIPRHLQAMEDNPDSLNFLTASSMSVLRAADSASSFRSPTNVGSSPATGVYDAHKGSERILPPERK